MDRLRTKDGHEPFPRTPLDRPLGLRDELKGRYAEGRTDSEAAHDPDRDGAHRPPGDTGVRSRQPRGLLVSETNEVVPNGDHSSREPDTRYAYLLGVFHALKLADPYTPTAPTFVRRRFDLDRQIPESEVRSLLYAVLGSDEVRELARRIESRLNRPLEPFDVWYSGFSPRELGARTSWTGWCATASEPRGVPGRPAARPRGPGLRRSSGGLLAERIRWSIRARAGARHGSRASRGSVPPPHAGAQWHELPDLQRRDARVGALRRAGLLARCNRPLVPERRSQHRVHRGVRLHVPGAGSRSWASGEKGETRGRARRCSRSGARTRSAG